jgi:hypothetical protein
MPIRRMSALRRDVVLMSGIDAVDGSSTGT